MRHPEIDDFDVDVDVSSFFGVPEGDVVMPDVWYLMAKPKAGRSATVQGKLDRMFNNAWMRAQWLATQRRALDRRRAVRVPLLSRVLMEGRNHMQTLDISLSGLRCTGKPVAPVMNVEFRVPGLHFPIDTRVEVMSYKDSAVYPHVGLRFIGLERPYAHHIAAYVGRRANAA